MGGGWWEGVGGSEETEGAGDDVVGLRVYLTAFSTADLGCQWDGHTA